MSSGVGSSTYSTRNSTNKGMMSMVSGMDTEGMVEAMLANTQKKINMQNADKQRTIWRQEIYRELITQISGFQNKFFNKSYGATNSLFSGSFFNAMKAQSTAKAFSVSAGSSASIGKTSVRVGQLATATSLKSEKGVSAKINGEVNLDAFNKEIVLEVGGRGSAHEVKIDLEGADTAEKVADAIKNQSGGKLNADIVDGSLKITSATTGEAIHVSSKSDALGLSVAGLGVGANGVKDKDTNEVSMTTKANPNAGFSISILLNGKTKNIALSTKDANGVEGATPAERQANLAASFQKGLDTQFGTGAVSVNMQPDGKFSLETTKGNKIQIGGGNGMTALGLKYAQSNMISEGTALKDMAFSGGKVQGNVYEFSINGVDFKFTGDDTISSMKTAIKNSAAGVELKYDDLNDQFTLARKNTGEGFDITIEQKTGNLLGAMFGGVKSGGQVTGNMLTTKGISGGANISSGYISDPKATFSMIVNGEAVTIGLPEKKDADGKAIGYTKNEAREEINNQLADKFGYTSDGKQAIKLNGDNLEINNGAAVTFQKTSSATTDDTVIEAGAKHDLALLFGLNKESQNNLAKADTNLADIGLGEIATLTGKTTLGDLTGVNGFTFNSNGRLTFDGDPTTLSSDLKNKLFGGEISLGTGTDDYQTKISAGQNALVTVNGVDLERTDNAFTIGGLTISLSDVTGSYEKGVAGDVMDADGFKLDANGNRIFTGDEETVDVARNTDQVVEGVKAFVDEYNAMITKLNLLVGQKKEYRNYDPLTPEQKKDMSESEIKLWEEKAKTGLLRGDGDIQSLLTEMRGALYSKPEGSLFSLYDIGIDTGDWEEQGKLNFKEADFRKALEENPSAVEELFTNKTEGIAKKMEAALSRAAYTTTGPNAGSLVRKAGVVGKASESSNALSDRLRQINDRLKELQKKYEKEKSRYWRQFNSMEQQLSNMNSQSSWLSQQFG